MDYESEGGGIYESQVMGQFTRWDCTIPPCCPIPKTFELDRASSFQHLRMEFLSKKWRTNIKKSSFQTLLQKTQQLDIQKTKNLSEIALKNRGKNEGTSVGHIVSILCCFHQLPCLPATIPCWVAFMEPYELEEDANANLVMKRLSAGTQYCVYCLFLRLVWFGCFIMLLLVL